MGGDGGGGGDAVQGVFNSTVGGLPIIGDYMKGQTAQDMAKKQGMAAEAQLGQQRSDRSQALQIAQPTDMELQQLQQAIHTNTNDIQRKQALLDSADPAFLEAGKQALQLMQGGKNATSAAAMQPIQQARDNQRQQLVNQLQQQLGPNWQQSTAGSQAMANFDAQTSTMMNNAQLGTLNSLMSYTGQAEQFGNQQNNIANNVGIAGARGNIQNRQISAIEGTPITMAGAPYAGGILSDQYAIGQMQGAQNTLGNLYGYASSGTNPFNGKATSQSQAASGASSSGGGSSGGGGGMMMNAFADGGLVDANPEVMKALINQPAPEASDKSSGGGGGVPIGAVMQLAALMNKGGKVVTMKKGGKVKGKAKVKGDSPVNDTVRAFLSPGEIVLPRGIVQQGPAAEARFAENAKRKKRG